MDFLPSQGQLWTLPPSAAKSSRQEAALGGVGGGMGMERPSPRQPGCAGGGQTARSPPGESRLRLSSSDAKGRLFGQRKEKKKKIKKIKN